MTVHQIEDAQLFCYLIFHQIHPVCKIFESKMFG